jgi:fructose-1-phosphate kinase PfkB-like protein
MIVTVTPNPALDRTLTVPSILFDEMVRASDSRLDLDGKGVNVSKALRALGLPTVIMGFAGGASGDTLDRGLREQGFATDFTRVAGETRTNTMIVDAASARYVKANEPGPTLRAEELAALFAQARTRLAPGDTWILSGSLPPGAPEGLYAELVTLIQSGGARALLDTSDAWRHHLAVLRRRRVLEYLAELGWKPGVQTLIAAALGVHRSTISRDLQAIMPVMKACRTCGGWTPRAWWREG